MGERPILFTAPMVRAILEGRKTQTRRVVKITHRTEALAACLEPPHGLRVRPSLAATLCPYGQPGDRLWVRETFSLHATNGQHRSDGLRWGPWGGLPMAISPDGKHCAYYREGFDRCDPGRWRPSIHMPRWASRITLEITSVRVERLQAISEADAIAEGIDRVGGEMSCSPWRNYRKGEPGEMDMHCSWPPRSFMTLWESINGPGSWAANPWVWVIEFAVAQEKGE